MNGFNALVGMRLVGPSSEGYVIELDIGPQHLHDAGRVHGGVYLSLLDTVMSRAVRSITSDEFYTPTISINANFFRPSSTGCIRAVANVVNQSKRACYVEGRIFNADNKLLAQGQGTMFFTQQKK